jgi:hypothetical protein
MVSRVTGLTVPTSRQREEKEEKETNGEGVKDSPPVHSATQTASPLACSKHSGTGSNLVFLHRKVAWYELRFLIDSKCCMMTK